MTPRKYFLLLMAVLGWFAVVAQFILMLHNRQVAIGESILRFFTYFTILTNVMLVIYFTVLLFAQTPNPSSFFFRPSVQTALSIYITIVGIVYNSMLRGLVHLEGLARVVDELLHLVIPLLAILYWYAWTNGKGLRWGNIFPWMIYPAVYFGLVVLRGHFSGFYPYPFINVDKFGYQVVAANSAGILVVFVLCSLLFIWIGRNKSHRDIYLV